MTQVVVRSSASPSPIALLLAALVILGAWVFLNGGRKKRTKTTADDDRGVEPNDDLIDQALGRLREGVREGRTVTARQRTKTSETPEKRQTPTTPNTPNTGSTNPQTSTAPPTPPPPTPPPPRPDQATRTKETIVAPPTPHKPRPEYVKREPGRGPDGPTKSNLRPRKDGQEVEGSTKPKRARFLGGDEAGPADSVVAFSNGTGSSFMDGESLRELNDRMVQDMAASVQNDRAGLHISRSPFRLIRDAGALDPKLLDRMQLIEEVCHIDWFPAGVDSEKRGAIRANLWIPLFGNVPEPIVDIVTIFAELVDGAAFLKIMKALIPPDHPVISPEVIESASATPVRDTLLAWFVLPLRAYGALGWSGGRKKARLEEATKRCGDPAASMILWLDHMGTIFLASRMFSRGPTELLDESMRIAIHPNPKENGYLAEVTLFAPDPDPKAGPYDPVETPLKPPLWGLTYRTPAGSQKRVGLDVVSRCLSIARNWIERCAEGGKPNPPGNQGYIPGVDPITSTRLVIRPGFSVALNNKNPWPKNALSSATGTASPIPRAPQTMVVNDTRIQRIFLDNIEGSIPAFRGIVQLLKPDRLTILNSRQNKWNPSAMPKQFDLASFEYMYAHFTLGLTSEMNPYFEGDGDEDEKRFREEMNGGYATFRELDFGGILPMVQSEPHAKFINLDDMPSVERVVLPFIEKAAPPKPLPADEQLPVPDYPLDNFPTANLLIDEDLNLLLQVPLKRREGDDRPLLDVIVVLQKRGDPDALRNSIHDTLSHLLDRVAPEEKIKWLRLRLAVLKFRVKVLDAEHVGPLTVDFKGQTLRDAGLVTKTVKDYLTT